MFSDKLIGYEYLLRQSLGPPTFENDSVEDVEAGAEDREYAGEDEVLMNTFSSFHPMYK